jgi:LysR family transcriptional regulator, glycine cleavage system transcriptional activator
MRSKDEFSLCIEGNSTAMSRRIPPFAAIRAFEAAARHLSLKKAAEELCVTPSAISHQIKTLEEFLGTALFDHEGNKLALRQTGQAYVGKLTVLLDRLDESTRAVTGHKQTELRVLTTPSFAARWLVPRLNKIPFWQTIRLRVSESEPCTDFASNDADIVIQWADAKAPGVVVEPLMTSGRYPVVSPALQSRAKIEEPRDLLRVTLFHDEGEDDGWADWFWAAGLGSPVLPRGPRFQHCELSTTAAERGQGVALAFDAMVRTALAGGTLVRLFEAISLPTIIYSVAYPQARCDDPAIHAFRKWVFSEVAADGTLAPGAPIAAM